MPARIIRPLLFFGFLAVIGLLSLADRAPDLVTGTWARVQRVGSALEDVVGVDLVDRGDIPLAYDTLGHLGLWFVAGALAYVAFGRKTSAYFLIVSLFTLSAGVEVGQRFLSTTRRPDLIDLAANGVGLTTGVLLAAMTLWLSRTVGRRTTPLGP